MFDTGKTNSFTNGPFVWFVGTIDDINDPEKDGRVRVRIFGYHPDAEGQIATGDLPWAQCANSLMSSATKGLGFGPHALVKGALALGFFLDGADAQLPFVMFTFAGVGDISDLIKGKNTVKKTLMSANGIKEPTSPYKAQYPHNKVMTTTSGHILEIDDTPGAERFHLYHKSGTYYEVHPNGQTVYRHQGDVYFLTNGNMHQITNGNFKHVVSGNYELIVGGNLSYKVSGSINLQAGSTMNLKAGSSMGLQSSSNMTAKSGGQMKMTAPVINLN